MGWLGRRFPGASKVVRFNWPYYGLAVSVVLIAMGLAASTDGLLRFCALVSAAAALWGLGASIAASVWAYDLSGVYRLSWLGYLPQPPARILAVHAGFDEISPLLHERMPDAEVLAWNCAALIERREASLVRAAHGADSGDSHPPAGPFDLAVFFFAAHEIRSPSARAAAFDRIALTTSGRAIVIEHMRDIANTLAFTLGVGHFLSKPTWLSTFDAAGLKVERCVPCSPFLKIFVLRRQHASDVS